MTGNILDTVDRLMAAGRNADAVEKAVQAADRGDVDALFLLATWHLIGSPTPRDLPQTRALLRRAVDVGHADAALMEVALAANGTGAPPDWARALDLLTIAARDGAAAAQQLALIRAMALGVDGEALRLLPPEQLSDSPHVTRYAALLTEAECRHVAHAAHPLLEPAVVTDPQTGRLIRHPVRTSHGAVIGPTREDLVIGALNRRIAAASGLPYRNGEPLAVLAYSPGQEYKPHLDTLPHTRNQRVKTVLVYLNDGYAGGETVFLASGLKIVPRAGDAIVFDNTAADGTVDTRSQHAGLPVTRGVKWLATRWIRARAYDPWNPD